MSDAQAPRPSIASTPSAITASWLTQLFRYLGHDVEVASVSTHAIGTGQSAHSERIVIDYAQQDCGLPASLVAKLPHPDPTSRATGHLYGSYAREVGFYRQVAPTVDVRTPRCWYIDLDPANSDFVLLLEDMAPAQQGDQMRGCDVQTAERAVIEIAGLHGPRWGDPLLTKLGFLSGAQPTDANAANLARMFYADCWQSFVARYRDRLAPEILQVGEGLLAHYLQYIAPYAGARCPTHGDYRLDNILLSADSNARIAVVDWQTAGLGCGASDVSYFLGAGLLPEHRRKHERELLRRYLDALLSFGVRDYSIAELWRDYARYSYAGYVMAVVASKLVVQTERGDEMFMVMAHRHGQHVLDVDAEHFLPA